MTWLSTEDIIKLTGLTGRWLSKLRRRGAIQTRIAGKAANGKPTREILLESLPVEFQSRYLNSMAQERDAENPIAIAAPGAEDGGALVNSPAGGASGLCAPSTISPLIRLNEERLQYADALRGVLSAKNRLQAIKALAIERVKSERTVRRDLKKYSELGISGLSRKKTITGTGLRSMEGADIARIQAEYLKPYRPTAASIYRDYKKDCVMRGTSAASYPTVNRSLKTLAPDLVARFRYGEREHNDKFGWYSERKKPSSPRMWADGDHHPWDRPVIFRDGSIGRPQLTAIRDEGTLEILGFSVNADQTAGKYSNRLTISHVIRMAILVKEDKRWPSYGIFEHFQHDLGKDFRSKYIRHVCHDLGITPVPTRGFHGQSKAIERWFRTMEDQLRHLPGYIGNKPDNNPEKQRIGTPRTWEEMRKELLTIDQLDAELTNWIVNVYHHAESKALKGFSPMGVLEEHKKRGWMPRVIASERALDLLLMERLERGGKNPVVHRGKIQAFGTKYEARYYEAPELLELSGQEVQVRYAPNNLDELYVYKNDRFVCIAKNANPMSYGATKEDMKRRLEIERHQRRRLDERLEEILANAQYPNPLDRAIAERKYDEVMQEERMKMVANARPERRIHKILPQFQIAEKGKVSAPIQAVRKIPTDSSDEKLLGSDQLFKHEQNPWLEFDDYNHQAQCHACGQTASNLYYCRDLCAAEGECCPKCHGREAHRYCAECREEHDHTTIKVLAQCHACGKTGSDLLNCSDKCAAEGVFCMKCHGRRSHRYCADCYELHEHVELPPLELKAENSASTT